MSTRTWRLGATFILALSVIGIVGTSDGVAPLGIIPSPPESSELEVRIWVDQGAYAVGDSITIRYSVSEQAYIYIWDIEPDGTAHQIFPNTLPGGSNNLMPAGEHIVPGNWRIEPPLGTEYLQILATTSPVNPFAFPMIDPDAFRAQIEVQILGVLPESERSWDFTSFEIISGTPPSYGTLVINSVPGGAAAFLDGSYIGYTPRTVLVQGGFHRLSLNKPGYQSWEASLFVIEGRTRTVNVTLTSLIPPNTPPTAAFVFSPTNPQAGGWVQFNASGSSDADGTIVNYTWSFGDGGTGTGSTPWHRFATPGTYLVTLTVTDDDGASHTATHPIQVGVTNTPPTASFVFSPTNPQAGGWVQFDASGSSDADGTIVDYAWNFGDGGTGTGSTPWHRFATPGTYLVTLTVTDDDGATHTVTHPIQVGVTNIPPTAVFTYSPASPSVSDWVRFDASGSSDSDGSIASYVWDFGDGLPAGSGSVVYHRFTSAVTYFVTLTVTDDDGASNTASQPVPVGGTSQPPVASFTYVPLSPGIGTPVVFNGQGSYDPDGSIVQHRWDFNGDGVDDYTGPSAQITYANAGVVYVRLTVVDNDGLTATTTQPIVVASGGGIPGMPAMGATPGVFVWGTDSWHITVNAGAGWPSARNYRLELRTDGSFQNVDESSSSGVAPLGLVPTPVSSGKTVLFEGSLRSGSVDYTFTASESSSIWMSLQMDIDGDGDLDESRSFVYLRGSMVHPPNTPFVIGLPSGSSAQLVPSLDFRIGSAISYTSTVRFVIWSTSISQLEAR